MALSTFSSTYEVVSVDRKLTPAFRLGSEVKDTLVIRRDGKQFTITLSTQHTGCGTVKLFAKGDTVTIGKENLHDGDMVKRDQIKLAQ